MNFLTLLAIIGLTNAFETGFDEDYVNLIMKNSWKINEKMDNIAHKLGLKKNFWCDSFDKKGPRPTSVHSLRPNDIEIIGAIGDSLTAANGAKASSILGLLEECRGVAWSIGSETDNLNDLVTLPNILKKFNSNLYGASTGSGTITSENAMFNLAEPGKTSSAMLTQATNMVNRMKASTVIDFTNSWKLVTIFIGGNDLCKSCKDESKYTTEKYVNGIKTAIDYLKRNLPRTLVNLVLTLDVSGIEDLTGTTCRALQNAFCDCALSQSYRDKLITLTRSYQKATEDLVNSGVFDTSDDFTVVIQPFMKNMRPPKKSDGTVDYSYFAPDCFHLSGKGHVAAAIELWNSMLTPVGQKQDKWSNFDQDLMCPTESSPFIFTNKNSRFSLFDLLTKI